MVTPSISQRGQRAHKNLSRGRRRSGKKKEKKNDYRARHANRLGERKKKKKEKKKNTLQDSPRRHTPCTATENTKRNQTITLATAAT